MIPGSEHAVKKREPRTIKNQVILKIVIILEIFSATKTIKITVGMIIDNDVPTSPGQSGPT